MMVQLKERSKAKQDVQPANCLRMWAGDLAYRRMRGCMQQDTATFSITSAAGLLCYKSGSFPLL